MPTFRSPWLLPLLLALPASALAHSVSTELTLGANQRTQQNPRSGFLSDTVTGVAELSEQVSLNAVVGLTRDNATQVQSGSVFAEHVPRGGTILNGSVGADWLPSERWTLGAAVDVSPRSTTYSDTTVLFEENLTGRTAEADALLRTVSSSFGLAAFAGWMTGGESDVETAVDGSASLTRFATTQSVVGIQTPRGPVSAQQVQNHCARATTAAQRAQCRLLQAALEARPSALAQLRFTAGLTETLFANTDVGLSASVYVYDKDPTEVGYFSVLAVGRTVSLGNGFPLAPLRFSVRPSVMHRFGDFWLDGAYQFGRYVDDLGATHALSVRAQYRLGKAWRVWLRAGGTADVDADGQATRSATLGGGVRFTF
ncbi:MAG TPA: hypothetical protein VK447_02785 [Myxococcaceae bacterium]|nr:hypothetical protein [Myxococcaceae bacterium]